MSEYSFKSFLFGVGATGTIFETVGLLGHYSAGREELGIFAAMLVLSVWLLWIKPPAQQEAPDDAALDREHHNAPKDGNDDPVFEQ